MSLLNDNTIYEKSVIHLSDGRKRIQFRALPKREDSKAKKKKRSSTVIICDIDQTISQKTLAYASVFFAQLLPPKGVKNNIFFYPFRLHYSVVMLYYKCKQSSLQLTYSQLTKGKTL